MPTGSKAFENPLISHARMRAMYRAMVEIRGLAPVLGRERRLPLKLEACWVGTAIGLEPGDLTSERRGDTALQHIRTVAQRATDSSAPRKVAKHLSGFALPVSESGFERLLCAAGAAMALRCSGKGVVLAYAAAGDLSRKEWSRLLAVYARADAQGALPLVLVITAEAGASAFNIDRLAAAAARKSPGSSGRRLPVLPVEAADAVALYRAAQESIGRARVTGAATLIECVPTRVDPVRMLGDQLIAKKICTAGWCARVLNTTRR